MRSTICITLLLWVSQDSTKCENTEETLEIVSVAIGEPFALHCAYDCAAGFVRGCWTLAELSGDACMGTITQSPVCTVTFKFANISTEDLGRIYTCYSEDTGHPELKRETQRRVTLQYEAHTTVPSWTTVSDTASYEINKTEITTASVPAQEIKSGEVTRIMATAGAIALMGLVVYLYVRCKSNGAAVDSPTDGPTSTGSHKDDHCDSEVPYADIMIAVRAASTPQLTHHCHGNQRERWRDEARLSPFLASPHPLQVSCSADRLNVIPREVSRKLSTNSEYAIITYS